jgi:hypothetical protein
MNYKSNENIVVCLVECHGTRDNMLMENPTDKLQTSFQFDLRFSRR